MGSIALKADPGTCRPNRLALIFRRGGAATQVPRFTRKRPDSIRVSGAFMSVPFVGLCPLLFNFRAPVPPPTQPPEIRPGKAKINNAG